MLSALAFWRPVVTVDRVDLSDGESLQWSGTVAPRRLGRLRAVARSGTTTVLGSAERAGGSDTLPAFHVMVDLRALLDPPTDIVGHLCVGRRRARIAWHPDAFDNANSDEVRPVAPDLGRGVQRSLRRESAGRGIRVVTTGLAARATVTATELGTVCRLRVAPAHAGGIRRLEWRLDSQVVAARATEGDWWEWDDLAALERPGERWSLIAVGTDDESPVHLPHSDLRHAGAARVFPTTDTPSGLTLALGTDAGNRLVLRCRVATQTGSIHTGSSQTGPTQTGPAS